MVVSFAAISFCRYGVISLGVVDTGIASYWGILIQWWYTLAYIFDIIKADKKFFEFLGKNFFLLC